MVSNVADHDLSPSRQHGTLRSRAKCLVVAPSGLLVIFVFMFHSSVESLSLSLCSPYVHISIIRVLIDMFSVHIFAHISLFVSSKFIFEKVKITLSNNFLVHVRMVGMSDMLDDGHVSQPFEHGPHTHLDT